MSSLTEIAFWHAPLPQLLVEPKANQIIAANSAACEFFGLPRPLLETTTVTALFRGDLATLLAFTDEAITCGTAWSDSLTVVRPEPLQNSRVEISARAIANATDHSVALTFQDAEELQHKRERSEAHRHYRSDSGPWLRMARIFQEFEHENRLILEAAGEGIYGVDAEGLTTFLNPAAEEILGWRADELIGKNIHNTIHSRHSDGSLYHVGDCPIYQAFREGVFNSVEDEVFWTKDRRAIDVEYTSTPIKDNGHVVGAVVIFRDVTEKKQAKKSLLEALAEVRELKHRLEMENAYLQEEINSEFNYHQIVGKSAAIQNVNSKIEMVAPTDVTVLISGESGTGKELIARAIHDLSHRSHRSLIRVNCAAIPSDLFESEFFGHSRGAFTGATSDRPGRFELADGGTLLLDEVGEIPLSLQGKLLRVLQEQQFERVGESTTRNVDVRIIAATNRNLKALVERGEFREDLYFRINVFPIESVPLRERPDDIPLLAQHLLQRVCARANKTDLKIPLSQIEILQNYHWPGNVRELENIIERQVILAQGDALRFDTLNGTTAQVNTKTKIGDALLTDSQLRLQERNNILSALKQCHGRVFGNAGAARLLGVKPTTLCSRIKRYRINTELFKTAKLDERSSMHAS